MAIVIKSAQSSIKRDQKALESMDLFLKFMAKQGIQIEYKNTSTAYYNLETNVITLPNYVLDNIDMFIRFGTHEAAHSLFTPNFFYSEHNTKHDKTNKRTINVNGKIYNLSRDLFSCINIVEDIRIEKLIRQQFPGLIAPYKRSAKALSETKQWNFLKQVKDNQSKFDELSIADKINLKSKFKEYLTGVDLSSREYAILKYVSNTKTFEDVLIKALFLFKLKDTNVNKMENKDIQKIIDDISDSLSNDEEVDISDFEDLENLDSIDKQEILDNRLDDKGNKDDNKSSESAPDESGDDFINDILDALEEASNSNQGSSSNIVSDEFDSNDNSKAYDKKNERTSGAFIREQMLSPQNHRKFIVASYV